MKAFNEYFDFNKRQERGVLILSLILLLVIILHYSIPNLLQRQSSNNTDNTEYLLQVSLAPFDISSNKPNLKYPSNNDIELHITQQFDPNTVSPEQLENFGLPVYVVNNIRKYREKGGRFKKKTDVSKIYGLKSQWYTTMEPYIKIAEVKKSKNKKYKPMFSEEPKKEAKVTIPLVLGLNTADSVELIDISGIGPYYAGSIVKYRKRLGGFVSLTQLLELYKMDSSKLNRISEHLFLDSIQIKKIPINTADFKTILQHPYINYETTKYIVNKRKKLGKFAALYQLKDEEKMPDSLFNKLLPYLSLD